MFTYLDYTPWKAKANPDHDEPANYFVETSVGDLVTFEITATSAHVIAAAPDMLAALEEVAQAEKLLASTVTTTTKMQVLISAKALRLVKSAIAKAKGDQA